MFGAERPPPVPLAVPVNPLGLDVDGIAFSFCECIRVLVDVVFLFDLQRVVVRAAAAAAMPARSCNLVATTVSNDGGRI